LDRNDLSMARQRVSLRKSGLPPPRADHLRTAILALLETNDKLRTNEIQSALQCIDDKRKMRIECALNSLLSKQIITLEDSVYSFNQRYAKSWEHVKRLTVDIAEKLFFSKASNGTLEDL